MLLMCNYSLTISVKMTCNTVNKQLPNTGLDVRKEKTTTNNKHNV